MREKFLIGATKENEIVFCEMEITTRNGYKEFSVSFDCVRPFKEDDIDLEDYTEGLLEGYDKATLYDMCKDNDCSPSQLASIIAKEESIEDLMDLSLYNNTIYVNGESWRFESSSCGQCDTREDMLEYVDEKTYNIIHELWDNFHLEEMTDNEVGVVSDIFENVLSCEDEETWIADFIERNID